MVDVSVSEVRFTAASPEDLESGLLGFVDLVLNGAIRLSGLTLRRTKNRGLALSYPARRDGSRMDQFYFRPIHDGARQELERQVIAALGHLEGT